MAVKARTADFYTYGTAAPTIQAMLDAETRRLHAPRRNDVPKKEWTHRARTAKAIAGEGAALQAEAQVAIPVAPRAARVAATPAKAVAAEKAAQGISAFAVLGALFVSVLMVFTILAQINYNETAAESVRLNNHLAELSEKHRALELAFESAIDIREVERFARDELGMSRPDSEQVIFINSTPRDTAMITNFEEERGLQGFGTFIKSLTEYFRFR